MRSVLLAIGVGVLLVAACTESSQTGIQGILDEEDHIRVEYNPILIKNAEMRMIAQEQCKRKSLILRDVTVEPTIIPTTSIARVFCK